MKTLSKRLGSDFIIQEGQVQSAAMSRFNDTSINTLRIATYLSVETHEPVVLGGVLRVGKRGSFVDNAHAGGCLVGIGGDGRLCPSCSDQYGNRFTVFNDMDFSAGEYYIPNYDLVRQFAAKVASALPHQRVLALDIMLDADDRPLLIEFNNYAFGVWAFQQTVGPLFGTYTQEVIEHCRTHLKDATRIYLTY